MLYTKQQRERVDYIHDTVVKQGVTVVSLLGRIDHIEARIKGLDAKYERLHRQLQEFASHVARLMQNEQD